MNLRVVTPPANEPVTLAEAKLWCRIDDDVTAQDAMVLLLIGAMRRYAENLTGRAFVQRTLELRLDCFPAGKIALPFPPLVSVSYLQYIDQAGTLASMDTSPADYQVQAYAEPACIAPLYGENWPLTRGDLDAVRVGYIAGYATRNDIPKNLKLWMQARIATLYENREQLVHASQIEIPRHFCDGLLDDLVTASRIAFVG